MKKFRYIFFPCIFAALLLTACAGPRSIRPVPVNPELCRLAFFEKSRRYIYALDAELPGGMRMTVMGIAVVDYEAETVQAAIMTLEGLLLFDATAANGSLQLHHALPPFDRPQFAEGLMRDVRFIFMVPVGPPQATGLLDDGASLCRYHDASGMTLDVVVYPEKGRVVEQYSRFGKKLRSLKMYTMDNGIPGSLVFEAFSWKSYALHMKLISAEPLVPVDAN
jgi:hypothetical protein